jgi:LTXXQ motif family protein
MWKAALAGAVALATVGSFSFSQQGFGISPAAAQEIVVTEGQIARLHAALHLTPAQERHWHSVAATLRSLGHQQQQYRVASADAGFVERTQSRVAGYAVTAVAMQRLRSVAQPLVGALSEEQKEAGRGVLASMGVSF